MEVVEKKISVLGEVIEREIISIPNSPTLLKPDISVCKTGTADGQLYWLHGVAYDDRSNGLFSFRQLPFCLLIGIRLSRPRP